MSLENYHLGFGCISALLTDLIHLQNNFRNCTLTIKDSTVFITVNLLYNEDVTDILNILSAPEGGQFDSYAAERLLNHHQPLSEPMRHLSGCLKYNTDRFATIGNYPLLHFGNHLTTQDMLKIISTECTALLPDYRIKTLGCMVAISPYYYFLND